MFLKLLPFFGQRWPIDGGASFLALFFQEISRKGARIGNMREKTGGRVLFEQDFSYFSKSDVALRKILENGDGSVGIAAFFQKISNNGA